MHKEVGKLPADKIWLSGSGGNTCEAHLTILSWRAWCIRLGVQPTPIMPAVAEVSRESLWEEKPLYSWSPPANVCAAIPEDLTGPDPSWEWECLNSFLTFRVTPKGTFLIHTGYPCVSEHSPRKVIGWTQDGMYILNLEGKGVKRGKNQGMLEGGGHLEG